MVKRKSALAVFVGIALFLLMGVGAGVQSYGGEYPDFGAYIAEIVAGLTDEDLRVNTLGVGVEASGMTGTATIAGTLQSAGSILVPSSSPQMTSATSEGSFWFTNGSPTNPDLQDAYSLYKFQASVWTKITTSGDLDLTAVESNIIPKDDATYSLGSVSKGWVTLDLTNQVRCSGQLTITASGDVIINPSTNQEIRMGNNDFVFETAGEGYLQVARIVDKASTGPVWNAEGVGFEDTNIGVAASGLMEIQADTDTDRFYLYGDSGLADLELKDIICVNALFSGLIDTTDIELDTLSERGGIQALSLVFPPSGGGSYPNTIFTTETISTAFEIESSTTRNSLAASTRGRVDYNDTGELFSARSDDSLANWRAATFQATGGFFGLDTTEPSIHNQGIQMSDMTIASAATNTGEVQFDNDLEDFWFMYDGGRADVVCRHINLTEMVRFNDMTIANAASSTLEIQADVDLNQFWLKYDGGNANLVGSTLFFDDMRDTTGSGPFQAGSGILRTSKAAIDHTDSPYTCGADLDYLTVDADSGSVVINIPNTNGFCVHVKAITEPGAYIITLQMSSGSIDGAASTTTVLANQWDAVEVVGDGTDGFLF